MSELEQGAIDRHAMALWGPPLSRFVASVRVRTGLTRYRERSRSGAVILVYHGVVKQIADNYFDRYSIDLHTLREHLRFLKTRRSIIPLSVLLAAIDAGEVIDDRWTVLTFDDALASQLSFGADLMRSEGVPWALAVPAGLVGSRSSVWTYALRLLLVRLWGNPSIPHPLSASAALPAANESEKRAAADLVIALLLHEVSDAERKAYIAMVVSRVGIERLEEEIERDGRFVMATWDSIRSVISDGVQICSHGLFHMPHNAHVGADCVLDELVGSKEVLSKEVGIIPEVFVLPNGVSNTTTLDSLRGAGYKSCLTSRLGIVGSNSDILGLPRYDAEYPLNVLRQHLLSDW